MGLDLRFYFADVYRPSYVVRALTAIARILADAPVVIQFKDIAPDQVTFGKLMEPEPRALPAVSLDVRGTRLRTAFNEMYVASIRATSRVGDRPISLRPFVYDDNTLDVVIHIGLHPDEESLPDSRLYELIAGAEGFPSVFSEADPLWISVAAASLAISLTDLREGTGHLPSAGYYGSQVVRAVGKDALDEALKECPKLTWLPSGGLLLDWFWHSADARSTEEYRAFETARNLIEQRIVDAVWNVDRERRLRRE